MQISSMRRYVEDIEKIRDLSERKQILLGYFQGNYHFILCSQINCVPKCLFISNSATVKTRVISLDIIANTMVLNEMSNTKN